MAGKKDLGLINSKGKPVSQYHRYKKLKSAVRRALEVAIESKDSIQIWDYERGQEVANIFVKGYRGRRDYLLEPTNPRAFYSRWQ